MEIKTCEEYVINELERVQQELSLIKKENESLKEQNDKLKAIVDNIKVADSYITSVVDMSLAEVLYKAKNIDVINVYHPEEKDQHIVIDITLGKEVK
jgi:adenine C2-methylase RlmN of 23S rRNA A2503 and tRNA A37